MSRTLATSNEMQVGANVMIAKAEYPSQSDVGQTTATAKKSTYSTCTSSQHVNRWSDARCAWVSKNLVMKSPNPVLRRATQQVASSQLVLRWEVLEATTDSAPADCTTRDLFQTLDEQATQCQLTPKAKMEDAPTPLQLPIGMPRHLDSSTKPQLTKNMTESRTTRCFF